jgi:hypothetical protein
MATRMALIIATAAVAVMAFAMPSGATVHEIIGQWCSGHEAKAPPGISDMSKTNFARPLFAAGVATPVPGFMGAGTVLIQFNFDHPAIKVVPAADPDPVQLFPGSTIWITPWTTDDDFPAFANCPGYVGGSGP